MHICLFFIFLVLYNGGIQGQSVTNIRALQEGKNIRIYYDLAGKESVRIELYVSENGGSNWKGPLEKVLGDVGEVVQPGNSKSILWELLHEQEKLQGNTIQFKVKALLSQPFDIEMVWVEGGTYIRGCTDEQGRECYPTEKPAHKVTLNGFFIDKHEVSQALWYALMGNNPSHNKGCDNCPVERVSWNDVHIFIQKLNTKTGKKYRLPTEAEWEYAARGGNKSQGYKYSGSNSPDAVAWYSGNAGSKTHPTGLKQANELGLYDMTGNIWEWCADSYATYTGMSQINPTGPGTGVYRVYRGGAWGSNGRGARISNRSYSRPKERFSDTGFRLAL